LRDLPELAAALTSERFSHASLADGSGVILDIDGMLVLTLNETGEALVRALLAGAADEAELVTRLVTEFEVEASRARDDVAAFVAELDARLPQR
jgi:hypothetical protein